VPAGELAARRRNGACDGHFRIRRREGAELQTRVLELEPFGLGGDGLALEETQDHFEPFDHAVALLGDLDAEHMRVGRKEAGADAEHDAAARLVIELDDAVRSHQRVVIGQRDDARAELDALGALGGGGDEEFGARDDLVAGRVMLADPGFLEALAVEPFDQFEIAADRQRRVFVDRVKGRKENAASQFARAHLRRSSLFVS